MDAAITPAVADAAGHMSLALVIPGGKVRADDEASEWRDRMCSNRVTWKPGA